MQVYNKIINVDWPIINLITSIERFDAFWPAIEKREYIEAGVVVDINIAELISEDSDGLHFWNETDIDTHPVVKCAILCGELVGKHDLKAGTLLSALLSKCGYSWAYHINLQSEFESAHQRYSEIVNNNKSTKPGDDITDGVIFLLQRINQAQNALMQSLDRNGVEHNLSTKEKQLIHVISSKSATKTAGIAKKLSISQSTTKRMLDRLITAKLIERQGIGPGSYYATL